MRSILALASGAGLALGLLAPPAPGQGNPRLLREVPGDPWRPRPSVVEKPVPLAVPAGSPGPGVQVNVDGAGENISGDAANEPSIAVDPTAPNRLVIGWRQFDTILSSFRQAGWAYSHDGGRSWTFPGVLQPGVFRSDPVLGADAEGTFYYCSLSGNFSVQFFKSFDAGVTWGPPLSAFGGDKQWFSIDRTGGIGDGNIYLAWNNNAGCCGDSTFTRSLDAAASFATPIEIFGIPIFGTNDVGPDGAVYVAGLFSDPYDPSLFLCARSQSAQDPGALLDFEHVALVEMGGSQVLGGDPNPGGLLGQAQVAVDHSDGPTAGNVYVLCSVDPPGPDPMDVMLARSTDGGDTFGLPVKVNDDPPGASSWQWFGTMSVAPDGRIDVVFNDTRASAQPNLSVLYYSFSTDGGVSFSPNVPLSATFDSYVGWPQQAKLGDYYQLISDRVGAHLAWAATFNGEQDVYYLRIGEYDCNDNGIADPDDIETGAGDCDSNGIPDECEIAAGTLPDGDGDGVPDSCDCAADLDGDGDVGVTDLLALLAAWDMPAAGPPDLDGSGVVDVADLLILLAQWGCP